MTPWFTDGTRHYDPGAKNPGDEGEPMNGEIDIVEILNGLRDRLHRDVGNLTDLADGATDAVERVRLNGKAQGVQLALGKLEEVLRELDN